MYKYLLIFTWLCITGVTLTATAQEESKTRDNKLIIEEIQKKQLDYFTKELDLDQEQTDKLAPMLHEYMRNRYQLFKKSHVKPSSKTENEYKAIIETMLETKAKETELENKYYKELLKIFPAEKVYKYHSVEKKYFRDMLQQRRDKLKKQQ